MSITKANIKITKDEGWKECLNKKGVVTVNNSCFFAYSDEKPVESINGNYTKDKEITNPTDSKLWIKANTYTVLATPNEV